MKVIAIISEGETPVSKNISTKLAKIFNEVGYSTQLVFIGDRVWRNSDGVIVDKNDFSLEENGIKTQIDCAYIYSEGIKTKGYIQGYLSLLGIPYISSSPLATMMATSKYLCSRYLSQFGVQVPKGLKINDINTIPLEKITTQIGFPCIVKPNIGTDSIMVEKVTDEQSLHQAIVTILMEGMEVLVEEFIEGREITCGVINTNGKPYATPITEIFQEGEEFYNYASKIHRKNIKKTPADLTPEQVLDCQTIAKNIFEILELDDFVRMDFILRDNQFYFLEVNVTPGMSERGNFPLQLKAMGVNLNTFFKDILLKKTTLINQ